MKRKIMLPVCILMALAMLLSSCNLDGLLASVWGTEGEMITTTEETTPESTTPPENLPEETPVESDEDRYDRALALLNDGQIEEAYNIFLSIKNYADVSVYLSYFTFQADEHVYQTFDPQYGTHYIDRYEYDECGRRITTESLNLKSGGTVIYFDQYDAKGHLIQTGNINTDGTTYGVTAYEYDEKGRPILQKDSVGTISLEYDEEDRIIKRVRNARGQNDTTWYAYDEQGRLIEQIYKPDDMRIWDTYTWEYNEYGDVIKRTIQSTFGFLDPPNNTDTVVNVYVKEYDENGMLIKITYEDGSYTAYEYDENGNEIKYTSYYKANDFVIFYFTYDENGNMTEYRREDETGITGYMHTTYDAYGNELERRDTDKNGNLTSISIYKGYKLYYNPNPQKPLPEEMVGKG